MASFSCLMVAVCLLHPSKHQSCVQYAVHNTVSASFTVLHNNNSFVEACEGRRVFFEAAQLHTIPVILKLMYLPPVFRVFVQKGIPELSEWNVRPRSEGGAESIVSASGVSKGDIHLEDHLNNLPIPNVVEVAQLYVGIQYNTTELEPHLFAESPLFLEPFFIVLKRK